MKRARLVFALLAVITLVVVAILASHSQEPVYQGKRLSVWLQDYGDGGSSVGAPVTDEAIRQMGTNAIPWLLKLLHSKDSNLKVALTRLLGKQSVIQFRFTFASAHYGRACRAFKALGPTAKAAVPPLIELLDNQEAGDFAAVGDFAAWSLAAIGPESVQPLIPALADGNPVVRARAADALGRIGPSAESAVGALVKCLKDSDSYTRTRAADALGEINRQPSFVVPAVVESLSDANAGVRFWAAESLGKFGARATIAITPLLDHLEDPSRDVILSVARALDKIAPQTVARKAVPVLVRNLRNESPDIRYGSAFCLGEIRQAHAVAVPALMSALDDPNPRVRMCAASALGEFATDAKAALPKLLGSLNDLDYDVRDHATNALKKIDSGAARPSAVQSATPTSSSKASAVRHP